MKSSNVFVCSSCGEAFPRWSGQCPSCGLWNTLVETAAPAKKSAQKHQILKISATPLSSVNVELKSRLRTRISEFDRVLGGGFVSGQVVLLAGEPGIGKSTLLLQAAEAIAGGSENGSVFYVSGEESLGQIALRAKRLGINSKNITVVNDINVESIISLLEKEAKNVILVIVDSVQTLYTESLLGMAGSVGQIRECTLKLSQFAKGSSIPLILVGHITKEGSIAGPKVLEHIVDTVLYLEGDKNHLFRVLKCSKNRFGRVDEAGIFEMQEKGMAEVKNPSTYFLDERLENVSGSSITMSMEGSRPFAVEVQALSSKTSFGYPKRASSGISINKVQILCAVVERRLSVSLQEYDIYVNVAGGLRLNDPAADLAVCLSLYSSVRNVPLKNMVVFGEVGLSGEVRRVPHMEKRILEAKRLGFKNILSPENVRSLKEAVFNFEHKNTL